MSELGYLHNTKQTANRARNEHRPEVLAQLRSTLIHTGIVESVEVGDTYGVGIYGSNGDVVWRFVGASVFPDATFAIDDKVWLIFHDSAEVPTIISGASSSASECSNCVKNVGMLTD